VVEHDPLSRNFPAPTATVLKTVTHKHYGPVLDQGKVGSCTGNATVDALMTAPMYVKGRDLTEVDAQHLYSVATTFDDIPGTWPPDDTGSSGLAVAKAAKYKGYISAYSHAFGLDHALAAAVLAPVIVGINWYEGFFTPAANGFVTVSGTVQGGHEIALIGVNVKSKYVTFINSWGDSWGKKGKFYMTFDTFSRLLSEEGDVTVLTR
jgi:C1A family cysteine protease